MRLFITLFLVQCANSSASSLEEFNLAEKRWIDPFTQSFIADLKPSKSPVDHDVSLAIDRLKKEPLSLRGLTFPMRVAHREGGDSDVFVITFHRDQDPTPLGVWIFSVNRLPLRSVTHEYLKFSAEVLRAHTGFGDAIFKQIDRFSREVRASSERLEAGWLGRYFWADKRGFKFDPAVTFMENEIPISQAELIRNNFRRFCNSHGIELENLRLLRNRKIVRLPGDLQSLNAPEDFLNVVHEDRRRIAIQPYVDHDKLGPLKHLEVGKAFAVSDYRPYFGQKHSVVVAGINRSDKAMPPWYGIRTHRCESALTNTDH